MIQIIDRNRLPYLLQQVRAKVLQRARLSQHRQVPAKVHLSQHRRKQVNLLQQVRAKVPQRARLSQRQQVLVKVLQRARLSQH